MDTFDTSGWTVDEHRQHFRQLNPQPQEAMRPIARTTSEEIARLENRQSLHDAEAYQQLPPIEEREPIILSNEVVKTYRLPWCRKLFWTAVLAVALPQIKWLAFRHPDKREYRIDDSRDVVVVLLEIPWVEKQLLKTTEQEGELVDMLFMRVWEWVHH